MKLEFKRCVLYLLIASAISCVGIDESEIAENGGQFYEPANIEQLKAIVTDYYGQPIDLLDHTKWLRAPKEYVEGTCAQRSGVARAGACSFPNQNIILMPDYLTQSGTECSVHVHEMNHIALAALVGDPDANHVGKSWTEITLPCFYH